MIRIVIFLLFSSFLKDSFSQKTYFLIDEKSGLPVEFAVVSSVQSNYYLFSDLNGSISLRKIDSGVFSISHLSYKTKLVDFKNSDDTIKLELNPFQLSQIEIRPNQLKVTHNVGYFNYKSAGFNWFTVSNIIDEVAVFIPGSVKKMQIESILYSIRLPKGSHMISAKLSTVSDENKPGKTIFAKSIEVYGKLKKNILEIPVLGEDISLDTSGIFIGISVQSKLEDLIKKPENPKLKEILKSININMTDQLSEAFTFIKIRGKWTKFESSTVNTSNMRAGLLLIKN